MPKSQMPKGVEHMPYPGMTPYNGMMPKSQMPKGVEHTCVFPSLSSLLEHAEISDAERR